MAKEFKVPAFDTLDEAKAEAAAQSAANPRPRTVYLLQVEGMADKYIVAQSVGRARNHAIRLLGDKIKLIQAEKPERKAPRGMAAAEAAVRTLTPEEIERVKKILDEMAASAAPQPGDPDEKVTGKKGRKKS